MSADLFDLSGRAALVTGAASGLGRELALALAAHGARVALADLADPHETARAIEACGGEAFPVSCDVTDERSVVEAFRRASVRFGETSILVNCAGVTQDGRTPSEDSDLATWERVISVNLTGTWLCCREGGKRMIGAGGGSIVNVASTAGRRAIPRVAAYSASKAGVEMLTRTLAAEWAGKNVRVNAVAPHYLETPMTEKVLGKGKVREALMRQVPMRRFGKPSEVVGAVLLLASGAGSFMTGSVIEVDGGFLA